MSKNTLGRPIFLHKFLTRSEDDNSGLTVHWIANAPLHDEEREPARRERTKRAMLTEVRWESMHELYGVSGGGVSADIKNDLRAGTAGILHYLLFCEKETAVGTIFGLKPRRERPLV